MATGRPCMLIILDGWSGGVHTAHSEHPAPVVSMDDSRRQVRLRPGRQPDTAPAHSGNHGH